MAACGLVADPPRLAALAPDPTVTAMLAEAVRLFPTSVYERAIDAEPL
jgi:hypothetical protein